MKLNLPATLWLVVQWYRHVPVALVQKRWYIGNGGTLQVNNVQTKLPGPQVVTISYINGDSTVRTATIMSMAGRESQYFSSTGSWSTVGSVKISAYLTGSNNTILFSNSSAWAPNIDSVTAQLGGSNSVYGNFSTMKPSLPATHWRWCDSTELYCLFW